MKADSYLTWKDTPSPIIAPEWRAPAATPRRKGVMGALSALAARLRPEV
jgi:hypothetical protein